MVGVGDGGDDQAVVELEGGGVEVFERGEGDLRGAGELGRGRIEVGVDDVAGDLELGRGGAASAAAAESRTATVRTWREDMGIPSKIYSVKELDADFAGSDWLRKLVRWPSLAPFGVWFNLVFFLSYIPLDKYSESDIAPTSRR